MTISFDRASSELSVFASPEFQNKSFESLDFFQREISITGGSIPVSTDIKFARDIVEKIIRRGTRTFPAFFIEQRIVHLYGKKVGISIKPDKGQGSISFSHSQSFVDAYNRYSDFADAFPVTPDDMEFDPDNPQNERVLYRQLFDEFGPVLTQYTYTQTPIDKILPGTFADAFSAQRADFVFAFPNGKSFVLEPGDHDAKNALRDKARDDAFKQHLQANTFRPRNAAIGKPKILAEVHSEFSKIRALKYIKNSAKRNIHENYLFLLPSLISRIEWTLSEILLLRGYIGKKELTIYIKEQDLCCAELAIFSFLDRLQRLVALYNLNLNVPKISLIIDRNKEYDKVDLSFERELLHSAYNCSVSDKKDSAGEMDIALDVSIKANSTLPKSDTLALATDSASVVIRNCFRHNRETTFSYQEFPRSIRSHCCSEHLLNSFLQDFFRKYGLRPGQYPILYSALTQQPTIGLLPTSGGKSACYQLAALLSPGLTLIVDPLVFLMDDQVQSLKDSFRITRVEAWHAGSGIITEAEAQRAFSENIMLFVSPERFLRKNFRGAVKSALVGGSFINYAVIDEAHCVSMWGHDFRPSYLCLDRNLRETCAVGKRIPITLALTGTASQLVLIDLKRELNIESFDSIIRPDSFDRPELTFRVESCKNADKDQYLKSILNKTATRLQVVNLDTEAWGIIFSYTPRELWRLLGNNLHDLKNHVQVVLEARTWRELNQVHYAMATGSCPKDAALTKPQWTQYKERILSAFKRGTIRRLFGNAAVGVGVDSEKLNYVVNYRMPQSLESYYQQCGRAGRSGQPSECILLLSDDEPEATQAWLDHDKSRPQHIRDDISTISYFHNQNFPGQESEVQGVLSVYKNIINQLLAKASPIEQKKLVPADNYDRTERYIGFLLIVGVVSDYTVAGTGRNVIYSLSLHDTIRQNISTDIEVCRSHMMDSLYQYLLRYKPQSRELMISRLRAKYPEHRPSEQVLRSLIDFIYDEIAYQRKESIRTMLKFCTQEDTSPEQLRRTIKGYFDRNEKFSSKLDSMAASSPKIDLVIAVLETITDFSDAEHLYWESRRLLDERFRGDWALINIYAMLYRERGVSDDIYRLMDRTLNSLKRDAGLTGVEVVSFLASYYSYLPILDDAWGEPLCLDILINLFQYHYKRDGVEHMEIMDRINLPEGFDAAPITLSVLSMQLKELIDVATKS